MDIEDIYLGGTSITNVNDSSGFRRVSVLDKTDDIKLNKLASATFTTKVVETSGKKIVFKKLACCAKCDGTVDIPTLPKSFTCQECHQNFKSQHNLNVHTLTHRTETCERCGKIFSRTTGKGGTATKLLKAHLKTCKGPKVYPCSGCGMEFNAKKKCQKHEASCKEMLCCKKCKKYFKTRTWTVRHLCSKFDT